MLAHTVVTGSPDSTSPASHSPVGEHGVGGGGGRKRGKRERGDRGLEKRSIRGEWEVVKEVSKMGKVEEKVRGE